MSWTRHDGDVWYARVSLLAALHGECRKLIRRLIAAGRISELDEVLTVEHASDGTPYYNLAPCPCRLEQVRDQLRALDGSKPFVVV